MKMNGTIEVNGAKEALAGTVEELLKAKDIPAGQRGVAVALNGQVVLRKVWAETRLQAGDRIEIVHARQGG
ncbi:MAG: sulfur carrier protein ThiS [Xanthobacteraceae bacterium]|nr:sulfur carrier protein ThiS [Xanthobacteraceae bacterium]